MSSATYHLWLKPTGRVREILLRTIRDLADQLDGPMFEPHVTILVNLMGTERDHVQRAGILTKQLRPFDVIMNNPSSGTLYFQSVFLKVEPTTPLLQANALAKRVFEKPDEPFAPHLSLAYGIYPESRKERVIRELSPEVRTSFAASSLHLIRADTNNPKDWHEIGTYSFTG